MPYEAVSMDKPIVYKTHLSMYTIWRCADDKKLACIADSVSELPGCCCRGYWKRSGEVVDHQQKPLLLLEFLIRVFCGPGQVVSLCCGSGSECIAALRMGKDCTGFNSSQFQVEETRQRLDTFRTAEASAIALVIDKVPEEQTQVIAVCVCACCWAGKPFCNCISRSLALCKFGL